MTADFSDPGLAQHAREILDAIDPYTWAVRNVRLPKGGRLDFERHPYLEAVYKDLSPRMVALKGAQMGFSTWAIARTLWIASALGRNVMYCFDDETTVLTKRGWLRHDEMRVGDELLALDTGVGGLRWSPCLEVAAFHYAGPMVRMLANGFDAMVTPDHWWPVRPAHGTRFRFQRTRSLSRHQMIPRAAPFLGGPTSPSLTDDEVELLAWVVTEGHYRHQSPGDTSIVITQALGSRHIERIRALVWRLGARARDGGPPREFTSGRAWHLFFRGPLASEVRRLLPTKELPFEVVLQLTAAQRLLLISTMLDGDGDRSSGREMLHQKSRQTTDAFALAALLSDRGASIRERRRGGFGWYETRLKRGRATSTNVIRRASAPYDGVVWCPRVAERTVVARRRGTIYVSGNTFPTAQDVSDFTQARINPIVRASPFLTDRILEIDNVTQKQFSPYGRDRRREMEERALYATARGDHATAESIRELMSVATVYFRGTGLGTAGGPARKGEREAQAADVDAMFNDELDRSDSRTLDQMESRLDASDMRWRGMFSTPKFPNGPIDRGWKSSDQQVWMIRCPRCREWQELRFPGQPADPGEEPYHNVDPEPARWQPGDPARFMCHRCGRTIGDGERVAGQWVAKRPGRGAIRGWRISQMAAPNKGAADILAAHKGYQDESDFWNLAMAVPFARLSDNLNADVIGRAQQAPLGGYAMEYAPDPGSTHTMGVDVGAELHIVVRRPHPILPGRRATVWLERTRDWTRLPQLMLHFNVATCVIDAHPEDRLAQAFADEHRGRVFRAYYKDVPLSTPGELVEWDPRPDAYEGSYTVKTDRTRMLDIARDKWVRGEIGMPRTNPMVELFVEHCSNVYRVAEHEPNTLGRESPVVKRFHWVENGPDHFRHADVYEMLAAMRPNPWAAGPQATTRILGAKTRGLA